jgi:thioredoxin-related protein
MKKIIITVVILFFYGQVFSQDMKKFNLYHPEADAKKQLANAVNEAQTTGKYVFISIGGNWCVWCARFNDFMTNNKSLDSLLAENYVTYHLNYSPENKNVELLEKYKFPQRFGFPVFLILNDKGELIHTQSSWYLEAEKSYDKEKVKAFLTDWSKKAFDPAQYKEE